MQATAIDLVVLVVVAVGQATDLRLGTVTVVTVPAETVAVTGATPMVVEELVVGPTLVAVTLEALAVLVSSLSTIRS